MQSEQINDLAAALAKAQGEIEGAAKSSENPHFRSRYADLGDVWDACRGPLTKHGLSIVQQPRAADGQLYLVTRILHSSGQWLEDDGFPLMLAKQDMQGLGSATTYARRYGLMAAVGIAPEDDDGNAASAGKKTTPAQGARNPRKSEAEARADKFLSEAIKALVECKSGDDIDDLLAEKETQFAYMRENFPRQNAEWKTACGTARAALEAMAGG